jgi:hypothetical protein
MDFLGATPPDRVNGLKIVDYRHVRFVLDHNTGLFEVLRYDTVFTSLLTGANSFLRDWRDPGAFSVSTVCHGIDNETRKQRAILFGENIIDMPGKPAFTLLIEEVAFLPIGIHRDPWLIWVLGRLCTLSMCFRLPVFSFGPSMTIITTHSVSL